MDARTPKTFTPPAATPETARSSIASSKITPSKITPSNITRPLLRWYDKNARRLPWRIGPEAGRRGEAPDPYRVWLSEIMLQQTTVATVTPRYQAFLDRWPTVEAMAAAPMEDILSQWAGLGYYARARNLHKCAVEVAENHGGVFPDTEEALARLPGIGPYTAAAVAAIAFGRRAVVVDGNIERVVARLFAIETPLPQARADIKEAAAAIWPKTRSGDFAQGLMDLGAMVCTPRNPGCGACPLQKACAGHAAGVAAALPVRPARKEKPTRTGAAFALFNRRGEVLLERRPPKGLLGGMLGLPGGPWTEDAPADVFAHAPLKTEWARRGAVAHAFTHFHLALDVYAATTERKPAPDEIWTAPAEARLPTVMKKALDLALENPLDLAEGD